MRDRTPTRALENGALRYGVYAEDGSLLRYEYLALEDDPTDPGTELSKATLLQDSTEVSLFGSAADRTIDEAFAGIAGQLKLIKSDMAAITLTVQDTNGKPIPEVLVQGILSENGTAVYTNANGVATGYIGEGQQPIKVSGYADLVDYSETVTVVKGTTITKTIKLTTRNFLKITSSQQLKFSGNADTVDISAVGGGGGGGDAFSGCGAGGGSGYLTIRTGVEVAANTAYAAVVGAGGTRGNAGGKTSFLSVEANGGSPGQSDSKTMSGTPQGGAGGRKGGNGSTSYLKNGTNGVDGLPGFFTSFTETSIIAGSGAGGNAKGGSPGGGDGMYGPTPPGESQGLNYGQHGAPGTDGTGGGGGGGGNSDHNDTTYSGKGAAGGSGCIAIRMHLKSAA